MSVGRTPSQTIGPFFEFGLPWPTGPFVIAEGTAGGIWVRGRLVDGAGAPVVDGLIETWQVSPAGTRGFGRSPTDGEGRYGIFTRKPEAVSAGAVVHAPHLVVSVFARGVLKRLVTRIYFDDEAQANRADPVLSAIADPAVRATLIAARDADGFRFDIRLQGSGETAFFDV